MANQDRLRAIDVYSGVGGWSLGLAMAGVEVVASYDKWPAANRTNLLNNRHATYKADVRSLELSELPGNIDIVVGSPPCTEFSYSNRGGGGNIKDGLVDIFRFLSIVDHLQPRWWVMENVPRAAGVIEEQLGKWGRLARFRHLGISTAVVSLEDFGLPQRRKRCLVGNLDFQLLTSYTSSLQTISLGEVVAALSAPKLRDPLYAIEIPRSELRDHIAEPFLDEEELRINEAAKVAHPVYNAMPFPDPLDRPVRTITATCTRVSRESVVIRDSADADRFRRLTLRERASLQGFPVTYQFFGSSYAQKVRMIGNALPPPMAFYIGHVMRGSVAGAVPTLADGIAVFQSPLEAPAVTTPEGHTKKYPNNRTFKFSVPSLRLKSGVRFELFNKAGLRGNIGWTVRFYFGTSKDICSIKMDHALNARLLSALPDAVSSAVTGELESLTSFLSACDIERMQLVWSHQGPAPTRPFDVLDQLGRSGAAITSVLCSGVPENSAAAVSDALFMQYGGEVDTLPGVQKLMRNACLIHAGMLVGSTANVAFGNQLASDLEARMSA